MKHVHIVLEDAEFEELIKVKGDTTWHDFLLELIPKSGVGAEF